MKRIEKKARRLAILDYAKGVWGEFIKPRWVPVSGGLTNTMPMCNPACPERRNDRCGIVGDVSDANACAPTIEAMFYMIPKPEKP